MRNLADLPDPTAALDAHYYADQLTMRTNSATPPTNSMYDYPRPPAAQLRSELHALSDLLLAKPRPPGSALRVCVAQVVVAAEVAEETGTAARLLRDLLQDLRDTSGFDARRYANQLALFADQIDA